MKKERYSIENKKENTDNGRMGRREFLVKAGKGAFLISMVPMIPACFGDLDTPEIDLSLKDYNTAKQDRFYFAVISDTHIRKSETASQNRIMGMTVEILNNYSPDIDFVILTGDCVDSLPSDDYNYYFNNTTALDYLAGYMDKLNMALYPLMGNHDYYTRKPKREKSTEVTSEKGIREQVFVEKIGIPGPYYAFEHKGVKFYCLNSMQDDLNVDWRPEFVGSFGSEQLAWLEDELLDGKASFFFHHHPLATERTVSSGYAGLTRLPFEIPCAEAHFEKYENWKKIYSKFGVLMNAPELGDFDYTDPIYNILKSNNEQIKAVFFGHTHLFLEDVYEGIPVYMTDSMKSPRYFLYDQRDTMRYHIIECERDTGNFSIYNEVSITYINDMSKSFILNRYKEQGMTEFIESLKSRGISEQIIESM